MLKINNEFKDIVSGFIYSLKISNFQYNIVNKNSTKAGKKIKLGFSTFALKSEYILGNISKYDYDYLNDWVKYLNNFQTSEYKNLPQNSYVDKEYYKLINKFEFDFLIKYGAKKILKKGNNKSKNTLVNEFILAESKQAISTLNQIGFKNTYNYIVPELDVDKIENYINSLNWEYPWNAGAQVANLSVLLQTQDVPNKNEVRKIINNKIKLLANREDGFYYQGNIKNYNELINGSMKILTGLDWLGEEIHYPEKLINSCIRNKPESFGCDLVDIVYVLYFCSKQLNNQYKYKEISNFFSDINEIIEKHYFPDIGGFSYYLNSSQKYYYGLKVSNGSNEPDLHGTLLLLWAISLIDNFYGQENFNILKP